MLDMILLTAVLASAPPTAPSPEAAPDRAASIRTDVLLPQKVGTFVVTNPNPVVWHERRRFTHPDSQGIRGVMLMRDPVFPPSGRGVQPTLSVLLWRVSAGEDVRAFAERAYRLKPIPRDSIEADGDILIYRCHYESDGDTHRVSIAYRVFGTVGSSAVFDTTDSVLATVAEDAEAFLRSPHLRKADSPLQLSAAPPTPAPSSDPTADMNRLFEIAGAYPPRLSAPADRKTAEALWHSVRDALGSVSKERPDDYRTHLALGSLYRCGYNLDLKEASSADSVVRHFKAATALEPLKSEPHYEAGEFLVAAGQFTEGKRELDLALSLATTAEQPAIIHNLCFATYYLKDFHQAVAYCTQALASTPGNPGLQLVIERSQAAAKGGAPPETVIVPAADVPDGKIIRLP